MQRGCGGCADLPLSPAPGKILFRRSHIRDVAVKRLIPIDEYCKVRGASSTHPAQSQLSPDPLTAPRGVPVLGARAVWASPCCQSLFWVKTHSRICSSLLIHAEGLETSFAGAEVPNPTPVCTLLLGLAFLLSFLQLQSRSSSG